MNVRILITNGSDGIVEDTIITSETILDALMSYLKTEKPVLYDGDTIRLEEV